MYNYWFFSKTSANHKINGHRLSAKIDAYSPESAMDLMGGLCDSSGLYLAADMLLLDNTATSVSTSNSDIDVFVTQKQTDDSPIRKFVNDTLKASLPNDCHIAMVRLNNRAVKWLQNQTDDSPGFSINTNKCKLAVSNNQCGTSAAFSTKAKTLRFFEGLVDANIDSGLIFTHKEWQSQPTDCLTKVSSKKWPTLIARSSSLNEDSFECSNAGAFESVANIPGHDNNSITAAIDKVFASFGAAGDNDEVFLQQQILAPRMSGVCTTRVVGKNAPYYVINYDDQSGRTDSVTAGDTNSVKTVFVYRNALINELNLEPSLKLLLLTIQQIESLIAKTALDIEFIIDQQGELNIVQIRPLVGNYHFNDDTTIDRAYAASKYVYREYAVANDGVNAGSKALFGIMPDANPAELIGIKPKPLAFSLYQHLITDNVVTNQRHEYGYRDVRPVRHMVKIGGIPYINVRSSFNSFTPSSIDAETTDKIINCYLDRLAANPTLHDKVEFDVVATTWFPGVNDWFNRQYNGALNSEEISTAVAGLKNILFHAIESIDSYHDNIEQYQPMFDEVIKSDLSHLHKAYTLIDICHHYGCKPFAHLARSAFIAVSVLKGLLNCGILSKSQYDDYLHSVESVSSKMEQDAYRVKSGNMNIAEFYQSYGHLRPGTYDICSEAYFENHEKYLQPIVASANPSPKHDKALDKDTTRAIESYFQKEGIDISFDQFDKFAKAAISGREYGKFQYTRFLSHGLHHLSEWGSELGLSRDDLAYLTVSDIHDVLAGNIPYDAAEIMQIIDSRKQRYSIESMIELPDIITSLDDFSCFHKQTNKPNFITGIAIVAPSQCILSTGDTDAEELSGKIILIDSADPGYDWLFGCSIAGLITKYGGANSHMAIRCAELNVPAAIGVGDVLYNKLVGAQQLRLDCASEIIREA